MAQLTCQDLTLGYEGKRVVQNLSFIVEAGNYLCIEVKTDPVKVH